MDKENNELRDLLREQIQKNKITDEKLEVAHQNLEHINEELYKAVDQLDVIYEELGDEDDEQEEWKKTHFDCHEEPDHFVDIIDGDCDYGDERVRALNNQIYELTCRKEQQERDIELIKTETTANQREFMNVLVEKLTECYHENRKLKEKLQKISSRKKRSSKS